jgi:hypothetical protein
MLTVEKKAARVANAKRHAELDLLVSGEYISAEYPGKGCSVGCDAIDIMRSKGAYQENNFHKLVADYFGTPEWLEQLRDKIFEGLPTKERANWHVELAEALPVNQDMQPYLHKIMVMLLKKVMKRSGDWKTPYKQKVINVVKHVITLHEQQTPKNDPRWLEAQQQAYAAVAYAYAYAAYAYAANAAAADADAAYAYAAAAAANAAAAASWSDIAKEVIVILKS